MQAEPEKYAALRSLIKAQVYDSPPDFRGIASGVGASIGLGGALSSSQAAS